MRWLFMVMLVLNLAYIGWALNQPQTRTQPAAADSKVPGIVLLSEMTSAVASAPARPTADTVRPDPAGGQSAAALTADTLADSPHKTAATTTNVAESASAPAITTTINTTASPALAEQPALPDTALAAVKPFVADSCYTLGPFRELDKLRALTRVLSDYVAEVSFRSHIENEQSLYWVYISPAKDQAAARKLGEKLVSNKIRDYYIINSGDKQNGLSLGHFRDKERAMGLIEKIRKIGLDPALEPIFKSYTVYWLDYRVRTRRDIPADLVDMASMPNVSRLDRSCE
jgi:hypothetical protein